MYWNAFNTTFGRTKSVLIQKCPASFHMQWLSESMDLVFYLHRMLLKLEPTLSKLSFKWVKFTLQCLKTNCLEFLLPSRSFSLSRPCLLFPSISLPPPTPLSLYSRQPTTRGSRQLLILMTFTLTYKGSSLMHHREVLCARLSRTLAGTGVLV